MLTAFGSYRWFVHSFSKTLLSHQRFVCHFGSFLSSGMFYLTSHNLGLVDVGSLDFCLDSVGNNMDVNITHAKENADAPLYHG